MASFGLGFRPPYYSYITEHKPEDVDFFEITSENFMLAATKPLRFLEKLRAEYPLAMHGVSLSIASFEPPSNDYLSRLKWLNTHFQPEFLSDHLCWTHANAHNSHDLLPLPYTREALQRVLKNLDVVQNFLGRKILLENPSAYVAFSSSEMSEPEFWSELCAKSGCGILLDINNVYVNAKNLGLNPIQYLDSIPREAVGYFHLAGHSEEHGILIDTHDHPVRDEVWELYKYAVRRWPNVSTLLEWDDRWPMFSDLVAELDKARRAHAEALKVEHRPAYKEVLSFSTKPSVADQMLYRNFLSEITERDSDFSLSLAALSSQSPVPREHGLGVYHSAYSRRLIATLKEIYPTLAFIMEDEGFSETVLEYLGRFKPNHFSVTMAGLHFSEFLFAGEFSYDFGVPPALLAEIARVEWAKVLAFHSSDEGLITLGDLETITAGEWPEVIFEFAKGMQVLTCEWDVLPTIEAGNEGTPEIPEARRVHYVITAAEAFEITPEEFSFLTALREGKPVAQALHSEAELPAQIGFLGQLVIKDQITALRITPSLL